MPRALLQEVQNQALRFLTPITWSCLAFFSHIRSLYGIRVQLTDLRLSNVALVISAYGAHTEAKQWVFHSLQDAEQRLQHGERMRPESTNPADNYIQAWEFFRSTTGSPPVVFERHGKLPFRTLYTSLLQNEMPQWKEYLRIRLQTRGWSDENCLLGLASLPKSIPQAHRWHFLRLHLNGHYTTARVQRAGVSQSDGRCCFCHEGPDSVAHILACPCVTRALEGVASIAPVLPRISHDDLVFQTHANGATRAYMIAAFCAIWTVRFKNTNSAEPIPPDVLTSLIQKVLQCPWVECYLPSTSQKERRADRIQPPPLVEGAYVFRSDGASRKSLHSAAGWGAAFWTPDGTLAENARGFLGTEISNNVAEYSGLVQLMLKALVVARPGDIVVFELDSVLVARQVQPFRIGKFACRSASLRPLFLRCVQLGRQLASTGIKWHTQHIYREFNQVADALANAAIDLGDLPWTPVPHL